jgi:hypothetical protein
MSQYIMVFRQAESGVLFMRKISIAVVLLLISGCTSTFQTKRPNDFAAAVDAVNAGLKSPSFENAKGGVSRFELRGECQVALLNQWSKTQSAERGFASGEVQVVIDFSKDVKSVKFEPEHMVESRFHYNNAIVILFQSELPFSFSGISVESGAAETRSTSLESSMVGIANVFERQEVDFVLAKIGELQSFCVRK